MEGGEAVAVGVHKGEQPWFDQLGVVHGGLAEWLEDHSRRQPRGPLQLQPVEMLELGEIARVEAADIGPPPFLVGLARRRQPLVGRKRRLPAVAQPVGLAPELFQGFRVENHRYPTEPSISTWIILPPASWCWPLPANATESTSPLAPGSIR